jgi:molybdopterin-containing oxidoreductase family iron-sulfur binding subunit
MSEATARAIGVSNGDLVTLQSSHGNPGARADAPVWILAGLAEGVITLPLGYGRWAAGRVGDGIGCNAYPLRREAGFLCSINARRTGPRHQFAITQTEHGMHGRSIVRIASLAAYRADPAFATHAPRERVPDTSLYPDFTSPGYAWGMAIDLHACIGCNACTIACQAENNIPVVGPEQVRLGREMHWIRVDRYDTGTEQRPRSAFQPVPCMHCEKAPCEEVCPTAAAVHDSEGLNVQVYNRCIGTRFCSNNCPYKVRRFNFLQYADRDEPAWKAMRNPEVTVRQRGVMEKCNYCLQRITRGRIEAEKQGRRLRDGEVVTACQAVCPTQAIVFGDLNDPASRVRAVKASPRSYALLAELNTRPRTTYLARVINVDPDLE